MASERITVLPLTGQRVDELLRHINVERWGKGRPAPLLRLVAYWSTWPQFAPISRNDIAATLDRTPRQAKYDHEVMLRLEEARVLDRRPGRPDAWRVNPDLRHWLGVPGIPSWRAVVSLFLAPGPDNCARVGPKWAGQSAPTRADRPRFGDAGEVGLSVGNLSIRARNKAMRARPPGETPDQPDLVGAPPAAPLNSSGSTTYFPHSLEAREGVSEVQRKAGEDLLREVRRSVRTPVIGINADRVMAVGHEHPLDWRRILDLMPDIVRLQTGSGVAQAVEAASAVVEQHPTSHTAARIQSLEAQLANYRRVEGIDHETIERLEAELELLKDSGDI